MRRQFGLRQQTGALPLDDLHWLNAQGYRNIREVPRMATWSNGSLWPFGGVGH